MTRSNRLTKQKQLIVLNLYYTDFYINQLYGNMCVYMPGYGFWSSFCVTTFITWYPTGITMLWIVRVIKTKSVRRFNFTLVNMENLANDNRVTGFLFHTIERQKDSGQDLNWEMMLLSWQSSCYVVPTGYCVCNSKNNGLEMLK